MRSTGAPALQPGQPYNCAVVARGSCPGINFLSHLPGTAPGKAVIGSKIKLTFEAPPAAGRKVPEWQVIW